MKAELPFILLIILLISAIVLVAVIAFFLPNFYQPSGEADAIKVFEQNCISYGQRKCAWELTHEPEFSKFLNACKSVYGSDKEAYSCLYSYCSDCKKVRADQVSCAGQCNICSGSSNSGINKESCCVTYATACDSVLECDACG